MCVLKYNYACKKPHLFYRKVYMLQLLNVAYVKWHVYSHRSRGIFQEFDSGRK